jgi:hypothetical protein
MTKSSSASRRKGAPKATSGNSKTAAKSSVPNAKKETSKRSGNPPAKGKKDFPTAAPNPPANAMDDDSDLTALESFTNDEGFSVFFAPFSVPLTKLFCLFPKSEKADIKGHGMKDRAFANEADKAVDQHLKRGTELLDIALPAPSDWQTLFLQSFDPKFEQDAGADMRDFSLDLAASDPLELFPPEEIDRLGNVCEGCLSAAWIAATACHGSVHLFFDKELLSNKIMASTYDAVVEDDHQCCVPISGHPPLPHLSLVAEEKQELQSHTCAERFGENPDGCCLHHSLSVFAQHFKTPEKNMTIAKWRHYFADASSKGTLISASGYGQQIRHLGSNLALSSPRVLFMAHEWVSATHLRPQVHSLAWIAAVETFGRLWLNQASLVSSVAETSNSGAVSDNDTSKDMDDESDSVEVSGSPTDTTGDRHTPSDPMTHADSDSEDDIEADDDLSAVTQDGGTNNLVQQRVSGTHRAHQLRHDIRLHVSPSEEADKAMISAAKTFLTKAKEMDQSLVVHP